jgi:hypothetical protein
LTAKKFISSWHKVFNSQNLDNLDDVLADEAVFTSPVVFKPMEGKEIFEEVGGDEFTTIPCLNDNNDWVNLISNWVENWKDNGKSF